MAAQQVAELENQIAQTNLETLQVRLDSGSGSFGDVQDARQQVNERFVALQDTNFAKEPNSAAPRYRRTGKLGESMRPRMHLYSKDLLPART